MGMTAILAMFAGVYHWFPKLYGKMMNKRMGMIHFWITIVCGYGVFIPMHFLGEGGMPRRYYEYTNFAMFDHFLDLNVLISILFVLQHGSFVHPYCDSYAFSSNVPLFFNDA